MNSDQDICGDDQQGDDAPIRATFGRPMRLPGETKEQAVRRHADAMFKQLTGMDADEYRRRKAREQANDDTDQGNDQCEG